MVSFSTLVDEIVDDEAAVLAATATKMAIERIPQMEISADDPFPFHVWHLGAIALASFSRENIILPDLNRVIPGTQDGRFFSFLHRATGLTTKVRASAKTDEERTANTTLDAIRLLSCQGSLQGDFVTRLATTLFLLELEDIEQRTSHTESPYDDLFEDAFGCTARDYAALIYALWIYSTKNTAVDLPVFLGAQTNSARLLPVATHVMERLSCDVGAVAHQIVGPLASYEAEALVQGFYAATPFIRLEGQRHLCPPHPFARLHAASGLFFQVIELARAKAVRDGASRPETNIANVRLGERFEELVAQTMGLSHAAQAVHDEHEYETKQNAKSPDKLVFSEGRETDLVLIQAKLKRLSHGAFYGFDLGAFEKDAEGALAETIYRSIRYLYRVERARDRGRLRAEHRAVSERVCRAQQIMLLGVAPMLPSLFRIRKFREALWHGVEKSLRTDEATWYAANAHRIVGWHILDLEELSAAVCCFPGERLFDALTQYLAAVSFEITADGLPLSFRDWIVERTPPGERRAHTALRSVFDRFNDWAISLLFSEHP